MGKQKFEFQKLLDKSDQSTLHTCAETAITSVIFDVSQIACKRKLKVECYEVMKCKLFTHYCINHFHHITAPADFECTSTADEICEKYTFIK